MHHYMTSGSQAAPRTGERYRIRVLSATLVCVAHAGATPYG